jgi:hypothetical protein
MKILLNINPSDFSDCEAIHNNTAVIIPDGYIIDPALLNDDSIIEELSVFNDDWMDGKGKTNG